MLCVCGSWQHSFTHLSFSFFFTLSRSPLRNAYGRPTISSISRSRSLSPTRYFSEMVLDDDDLAIDSIKPPFVVRKVGIACAFNNLPQYSYECIMFAIFNCYFSNFVDGIECIILWLSLQCDSNKLIGRVPGHSGMGPLHAKCRKRRKSLPSGRS